MSTSRSVRSRSGTGITDWWPYSGHATSRRGSGSTEVAEKRFRVRGDGRQQRGSARPGCARSGCRGTRDGASPCSRCTAVTETLTGTAPLIQTAQNYLAVAAINGGYFNRNNRLPLGAIRRDNQWISGPILNRGAIAWNNNGQFYFGRLTLTETLTSNNNQRLPILFLNSGYVQGGIARYTPAWGTAYTPLTDNENIIVVENNQVTNQLAGGKSGTRPIPIPKNGYLLTFRSLTPQLPIGTTISITSTTTTPEFSRYPHIIGAGPLLVQNRQIVLDGLSRKIQPHFYERSSSS